MHLPCLSAQIKGNGNVVLSQRKVGSFQGVDISSGIDLIVEQGDVPSLKIKADENLHEYTISEVRDNVLHVYVQKGKNIWNRKSMEAHVILSSGSEAKLHVTPKLNI